jgi:hypothetical protein
MLLLGGLYADITMSDYIRFATINFQSINAKKHSFWNFLDSSNPDIICGNETWFKPSMCNSEILPDESDYEIFLEYSMLLLGGLYADITTSDLLESHSIFLAIISQSQSVTVAMSMGLLLILGDLNLPDINWSSNTITSHQYRKEISEIFLALEEDSGLIQSVNFPTRDQQMSEMMFDRSLEYSMLLLGGLYADITMSDLLESHSIFLAIFSQSQSVTCYVNGITVDISIHH